MSRKWIFLIVAGLPFAIVGLAVIVQQWGERRLEAAMERFEVEIGTLDVLAHAPVELPDDINAAWWLQQGARALAALSDADRAALTRLWEGEGDPGPGVEGLLTRCQPALEHLRRAGELRASSWGIRYDAGPDAPLPDFLPHLMSMRALVIDARAGLAGGDRDRVLADVRALVTLRRALEREPLIVSHMIAARVELAHHQLIQDILWHRPLSDFADAEILGELAGQLDVDASGRSLRSTFAAEAARTLDSFDAILGGDGSPWQRLRNVPIRMWAPIEYASAVDFYYRMAKATEMTAVEIKRQRSELVPSPGFRIIAAMLIPYLLDRVDKDRASAATRRVGHLAIQARLHAFEHGVYPSSLGGFAGADLTDPYSGGALDYTRHVDGSADVSFPSGADLWQRENAAIVSRQGNPASPYSQPRFVWRLPTPEPTKP